jgi:tetratricopeptide (TPR) repeat protein
MPTLFQLDAKIHSLRTEIDGRLHSAVSNYHLAARLDDLADTYVSRSYITRSLDDLATAKACYERAISLGHDAAVRASPRDLSNCWFLQAGRLRAYWQVFGSRTDDLLAPLEAHDTLDRAIDAYSRVMHQNSTRSSMRREAAHNRGNLLAERYDLYGREDDLHEAIANGDEALALSRPSSPSHGAILNDVGLRYQARWDRYGHVEDLVKATRLGVCSVADQHCDEQRRVQRTLNLCVSRRRLADLGCEDQLEVATDELRAALSLCQEHAPKLMPQVLARLAISMQQLSTARGDPQLQWEAAQLAVQALQLAPADQIEDDRDELVMMIAGALSEGEGGRRSREHIAALIASGRNPLDGD